MCLFPAVLDGESGTGGLHGRPEGPDAWSNHADVGLQSGGHRGRAAAHSLRQPACGSSAGEIRPDQHPKVSSAALLGYRPPP